MKRFQECNTIEKVWRYRWYLALPFLYLHYKSKALPINEVDDEGKIIDTIYPDGKLIWKLTKSEIQVKMNWVYTPDEVFKKIKDEKNR